MSIRFRLIIAFLIITVVPVVILGVTSLNESKSVLAKEVLDEHFLEIEVKNDHILFVVNKYISQITLTRDLPPVQGIIRARETGIDEQDGSTTAQWTNRFETIFSGMIESDNDIDHLTYLDNQGNEIVRVDNENNSPKIVRQQDLESRGSEDYFTKVSTSKYGETHASSIHLKKIDGDVEKPLKPIMTFSTPVFDEDGNREGAIIFNVKMQPLLDFLARTNVGGITVLDKFGEYIYSPEKEQRFNTDLNMSLNYFNTNSELLGQGNGTNSAIKYDDNGDEFRIWTNVFYNPDDSQEYWMMLSIIPTDELFEPIITLQSKIITTVLIVLLITIFVALIFSNSISEPLKLLAREAEKIATGERKTVIKTDRKDEIGQLANSFNRMTQKLLDANIGLEDAVTVKTHELEEKVDDLEESKNKIIDLLEAAHQSEGELKDALKENKKFTAAIVNASDGIILWDFKDKNLIRFVNPAWEKMYGYTAREVVDKISPPFFQFMKEDSEFEDKVEKSIQKYNSFSGEISIKKKNGDLIPVEITVAPIRDEKQQIYLWVNIVRDISKRKQAEAKVAELNKLRDKFIRIVSHQLRTPLNAIRWNLETLLSDGVGKLSDAQKEFIHITYEADVEVIRRIADLLVAIDIEEGKVSLDKENISIESLWRTVMTKMEPKIKIKELQIEYNASKKELPTVHADPEKIHNTITKLVENAVAYSDEKEKIEIKISSKGKKVRFEITDVGIGIPKAEQKQIFTRFFRASNATSMLTDASGLGLYISKNYIKAHNGEMGFESVEGKGSTFWFELPI